MDTINYPLFYPLNQGTQDEIAKTIIQSLRVDNLRDAALYYLGLLPDEKPFCHDNGTPLSDKELLKQLEMAVDADDGDRQDEIIKEFRKRTNC